VSVAVCAYDRLRYLPQALASIRAQTWQELELLLVDDGSTDGTAAWARRQRPRLRLLRSARNRGPAAARNMAWRAARGTLMAWLDSDDLWYPRFVEKAAGALLSEPRLAAATTDYDLIDARGGVLARAALSRARVVNRPFHEASGLGWIPKPSFTVVRRGAAPGVAPFDEGFRRHFEDVDFFFRLAARCGPRSFRFLGEPLGAYRRHGAQLTGGDEQVAHIGPRDVRAFIGRLSGRALRGERSAELLLDLGYLGVKAADAPAPAGAAAPRRPAAARANPRRRTSR
jgi:glycosyltransferase involved in cell wall biosynthesis